MFIRHLALLSFASLVSQATLAQTANSTAPANPGYVVQRTCAAQSLVQKITDNQGSYDIAGLLTTGLACAGKRVNEPAPADNAGHEASENLTSADRKSASTVTAACKAAIQGTSASEKCPDFMGKTAGQFKKNIDDLTQQIHEAENKTIEAEKNFQTQQQELTKQMNDEQMKLISTLPAQKASAITDANQKYLDQQAEANKSFTALQNQYTDAQKTYANALSAIKSKCFADATAQYQAALAKLNAKAPTASGINSSSNQVNSQLNKNTYQTKMYNYCLNNVAGAQAATQAANDLASAKQQLDAQVNDLNIQRANLRRQLTTALTQINIKNTADMYAAKTNSDAAARNLAQLNDLHQKEQAHNQQVAQDLQKQIAQSQQIVTCVEDRIGTVPKDSDDSNDQQIAYTSAKSLVASCWALDGKGGVTKTVSVDCTDSCGPVSNLSPAIVKATLDTTPQTKLTVDTKKTQTVVPSASAPVPISHPSSSSSNTGSGGSAP